VSSFTGCRSGWLCLTIGAAVVALAGCAHPARTKAISDAENRFWTGRLSLQVASEPPQSFAAGFELKGSAGTGELLLTSPLGSTLANMAWSPGQATLRTGSQERHFDSLETLSSQITGTPLPVRALFAWLEGLHATADGWQADLSRMAEGRLVARRTEPAPAAELRLILDK
jgi:outer membrane lipoprotein LolB